MQSQPHHESDPASTLLLAGSHDGAGAGDHDLLYRFGRRPRASAPFPFTTRQYVRLLVLRSRLQALAPSPSSP
jgi:hypothetical protein